MGELMAEGGSRKNLDIHAVLIFLLFASLATTIA
jgi:hypothetical protein